MKRVNSDEMSNADELCEEGVGVRAGGELRTEAGAGCDVSYAAFCAQVQGAEARMNVW